MNSIKEISSFMFDELREKNAKEIQGVKRDIRFATLFCGILKVQIESLKEESDVTDRKVWENHIKVSEAMLKEAETRLANAESLLPILEELEIILQDAIKNEKKEEH